MYFGTDRDILHTNGDTPSFGGGRGDRMVYGQATVTIPAATHRLGEIERPSWLRLEFAERADQHFTVSSLTTIDLRSWMSQIALREQRSPSRPLLLFVHGYKVGFQDALFRTAQMAFDVRFPGPAVLFSWPSEDKYRGYTVDEATVDYAVPDLTDMLRRLLDRSGAANIYLIAHSMGNRILAQALLEVTRSDPTARARIKDVILAAPDIDAAVFKRSIAPRLTAAAQSVTLYASSRDEALRASGALHGYQRAGDTYGGVLVYPPIVTIDASSERNDFLGHSYISDSPRVLRDVRETILRGASPSQRGLVPVRRGRDTYWRFPAATSR